MAAELGQAQLARLFPAFIAVDGGLAITAVGPSLQRQLPGLSPGAPISRAFDWSGEFSRDSLLPLADRAETIVLVSRCGKVRLSGTVLRDDEGFVFALRHAPTDFLSAINRLQICDFGPDDPLVSGLMLAGLQRAMIEESREVALDLVRERQRSLELLERISRAAGFIAHDFNNFLSIIRLNSERLLRDLPPDGRQARLAESIHQTAERGAEITRSLSTLSGRHAGPPVPMRLDSVIAENAAFLSSVVGGGIDLHIDLGASEGAVAIGRVALLNCLTNLLINARDAMQDGGEVRIATAIRHIALEPLAPAIRAGMRAYYAIEVSDTGTGMPAEAIARAFEPLFTTKRNGHGLGLASVLELVRDAGGDACVGATGEGTSIYVYLPLVDAPADGEGPAGQGETPPAPDTRGVCVIVVEDEPYALEALGEMLEDEGMGVCRCPDAEAALAALAKGTCDVLLTDVVMPGMDGIALARLAEAMMPGIRIVLMSGQVPRREEIASHWSFIPKPIDTRSLLRLLERPCG